MSYPQRPRMPADLPRNAAIGGTIMILIILLCCAGMLIENHSTAYWLGRLIGMGIGACIITLALIIP